MYVGLDTSENSPWQGWLRGRIRALGAGVECLSFDGLAGYAKSQTVQI